MIKHWRKWLLLLVSVLAVTAIMLPATSWMEQNVKSARVVHNSRMQPIILIPGSSATEDRFNTLITQLNAQTTGHSLLKITVKTNGTLTYSGKIAARDTEPYIVVAFENNKDGYNNIKKQAAWLTLPLSNWRKPIISIVFVVLVTVMAA